MKFNVTTSGEPHLLSGFGGTCLGHRYSATDKYITRDGSPYIYRMGELHFSRLSERDWERELLKMKAGGIEIVASYLFWIHHEETEGEFDFSGSRSVRSFCELCRRLDMPFFLRIGPWAHGEARNGGFPDWLIEKCGGRSGTRTNKTPYLDYVKRYFARVREELMGLEDVIIGIQVENELRDRPQHIELLKEYLVELGFDPPFWSATAWGGGGASKNLPRNGFLPMYGGYPEAPWSPKLTPILDQDTYFFADGRGSAGIGNDLLGEYSLPDEKEPTLPYLTCELGGGNQVTYHRRPIISADDIAAMTVCSIGSGVNGLGYYMYHGGANPAGRLSTLQETRSVGDTNDYPCFSYDFQSPLGGCGQIRDSYFRLRSIFDFITACGEALAPMPAFMPDRRPSSLSDTATPRMALRSDGRRGFLFVNNHIHGAGMPPLNEHIVVSFVDGAAELDLSLSKGATGIIPLRFPIGSLSASYVSAMPVSVSDSELVFEPNKGIRPEICLEDGTVIPLCGTVELGGVRVTLRQAEAPTSTRLTPVEVRQRERLLSDAPFDHITNRDGSPLEPAETVEYVLTPPTGTAYLVIDAVGNAAAMYHGDEFFDDFYLYGDRWICDIRGRGSHTPLVLKILPLTEENKKKIYFERDIACGNVKPRVYAAASEDIGYILR